MDYHITLYPNLVAASICVLTITVWSAAFYASKRLTTVRLPCLLFGLWVTFSLIFDILVVLNYWKPISGEFEKISGISYMETYGTARIPVLCGQTRGEANLDFVLGNPGRPDLYGTCWYELSKFRKVFPEYDKISDLELAKTVNSKPGYPLPPARPIQLIAEFLVFAGGMPMIALLMGTLMNEIAAGILRTRRK